MRKRWGRRVQKISLDIGAGCPHRRSLTEGGCVFCDSFGGGSGAYLSGITLENQIIRGFERLRRRYGTDRVILYFQSYSTTNLPVGDLVKVIEKSIAFSENLGCVAGIALGARPDQVPDELLRFLEMLAEKNIETWLELGVQTTDESGLEWLNRGHGIAEVEDALERSRHCRGLSVCAHLIAGIPGEKEDQLAGSAEWLSARGIHGVKFHPLYVLSGTPLERLFRQGLLTPLTRSAYTKMVVNALRRLRPDVVIQRLSADASSPRLVAPEWVSDKKAVIKDIEALLEELDARQGDHWQEYCGPGP
ncbi:MAG: TIGR01212 family radical SAM protein [Thermovirgaceae bacterium]